MAHRSDSLQDLFERADIAAVRAAEQAIRRARETGTSIIIWKEGRMQDISPRQTRAMLNAQRKTASKPKRRGA
jgi:apolipoprotein N-acyltransferase